MSVPDPTTNEVNPVAKLYGGLTAMALVFAAAMSFMTLSVYELAWWWGVVGGGLLVVFAGMGGAVVPGSLHSLTGGSLRTAKAFLQLFGSICGLMFFMMATISWALGKRYVGSSSGYTTLGIFVFLGLAGVGIQGALAMVGYFAHVRNQAIVAPRRAEAAARHAGDGRHAEGETIDAHARA